MVNQEHVSQFCNRKTNMHLSLFLFSKLILLTLLASETLGTTETPTAIERMLIHSFFTAINCKDPLNPGNITIALSPFRMLQSYALIRRLWKEPDCDTGNEIDFSTFNVNSQSTWLVCAAGECRNKVCQCMKFVEGKYCTIFTGKCWLMYCRLTLCGNRAGPILHCSCDSTLSKAPIVTKQYWYDEGLETTFRPPPKGWKDKPFYYEIIGRHIVTLVSKTEKMYLQAEDLAIKLIDGSNFKNINPSVKKTTKKPLSTTKSHRKLLTSRTKATKKTTPKPVMEEAPVDYLTDKIPFHLMENAGKSVTKPTSKSKRKTTIVLVEKVIDIGPPTTLSPTPKNTVVFIEKDLPLNTPPRYYFGRANEELVNNYEGYETEKALTTESDSFVEYISRSESSAKSLFPTHYIITILFVNAIS